MAGGEVVRACIVDCESTGLDFERDEPIEVAFMPIDYERATGRVIAVHPELGRTGFREPSIPIPPESQRVHGITHEMVAGKTITDEQVAETIADSQLIIAHHAWFDRQMLEKVFPSLEQKCWACSLVDIDWPAEGLQTAKLDYLLMRQGWFFDGHRAEDDALALLFMLTLPLPVSGTPALAGLLQRARQPLSLVLVSGTDYGTNGLLKSRGYRWIPQRRAWALSTPDPAPEVAWVKASEVWTKRSEVTLRALSPKTRYSQRVYVPKGAAA